MPDQMDFELRGSDASGDAFEPEPPDRRRGPLIAIAVLLVAVGIAVYVAFFRGSSAPVTQEAGAAPGVPATEEPVKPLGPDVAPIELPPLDESDSAVRTLVAQLSSHPRVAAWLATRGLVRNFTVVVSNIAEGTTPAVHLQTLRPSGSFAIREENGRRQVDPKSYDRYGPIADAVASLDPAGSARLYATLKPRIEEAYRDLGLPEASFDRTLERAIVVLLSTPIVDGPVEVVPRGIVYGYADPRLQSLTAAQKQLLRMGPRHARTVQRKLRDIAVALGISPARLPPPH